MCPVFAMFSEKSTLRGFLTASVREPLELGESYSTHGYPAPPTVPRHVPERCGTEIASLLLSLPNRSWEKTTGATAPSTREVAIRKFTVNLLGAAALFAAGVALLRQGDPRPQSAEAKTDEVPPGEKAPGNVRLERLRELGI